ncbi:hypothetical protein OJ997_23075 [Solirubrobacter phytolaccae]|uniref:DUF2165 family protein n=1 Tax=Solirubrobacter phytolaccae TaxID=1404360 RepID=A0A9X3SHH7_9ACTN|nr:hypothetical protein [Solirubrobacter phytolaccae]MDA0183212.1 hypothetical protein [Solirubrobacter phytolaccae]
MLPLKRILIGFWAMYFSIVALSNAIDLLDSIGALHWTFLDSTNYDFMRGIVKIYDVGPTLTKLLLLGAFAVETVGAVLFWQALLGGRRVREALAWSALVWTAFVFMTEFFIAYTSESTFRELLMLTIGTALAVELLPD